MPQLLIFDTCDGKGQSEMAAMRTELLQPYRTNPAQGSRRTTTTGRPYLWGPNFNEMVDAWPNFVLELHGLKSSGLVLQYSALPEFGQSYWSSKLYRVAMQPPMTEAKAAWIAKEIRDRGNKAVVASASLLSDLVEIAVANGIDLDGTTFLTTFEYMPDKSRQIAMDHGIQVIEFMREWFGGLTIYRCPAGKIHVVESACVAEEIDGKIVSTDPHNKAQAFRRWTTGHEGKIIRDNPCPCGSANAEILIERWNSGFAGGEYIPQIVPGWPRSGVQILERKDKSFQVLYRNKREPAILIAKNLAKRFERVSLGEGYFVKGGKVPPVASELSMFDSRALTIHAGFQSMVSP